MTTLELRDVSKVCGEGPTEVDALRDVSLMVDAGELVAVMGPSGSGKSTLLTIAGSLEEPTRGEVLVGGVALSGMSRNDWARLRRRSIGYVFQDFNLLAGLTAAENVSLPLELDGRAAKAARAAAMMALEELGLGERATRFPDELAGDGGAAARRAMVRWSWRLFRREWRRQALVLGLLMVAVAGTTLGLGVASNASNLKADPMFGTANTIITIPGSDTSLASDIAAIQNRFGTIDVIAHQNIPIPGSVSGIDLRAENPGGRYGRVTLRLKAGRYPTDPGEV